LGIAVFGAVFGMLLLLGSLQLYFDFRDLLTNKTDLINPQFIVINKSVSMLNTISIGSTTFSQEEIEELKNLKGISRVGVFTPGLFPENVYIKEGEHKNVPGLYTDLFFESVPDEFMDVKTEEWKWHEGDEDIPVIVPEDYLNLYNFVFAPARGMPQISKSTIKLVSFNIRIVAPSGEKHFQGHIAGFSDRINSILVPQAFMDYANKNFASEPARDPSRLILMSTDPSSPELADFLSKKGYETNSENLRNSKYTSILHIIMNIMVVIGSVIILMAVLSFIQYSQLLINRSRYEIRTLIQLGSHYVHICLRYVIFYAIVFLAALLIALILLWCFKARFNSFMIENGFEMNGSIYGTVWLAGLALLSVFFFFTVVSIFSSVRKLAKPG
jgi:hypothetical protein